MNSVLYYVYNESQFPKAIVHKLIRKNVVSNYILADTVRSKECWVYHSEHIGSILLDELLKAHEVEGLTFLLHDHEPIEGEICDERFNNILSTYNSVGHGYADYENQDSYDVST